MRKEEGIRAGGEGKRQETGRIRGQEAGSTLSKTVLVSILVNVYVPNILWQDILSHSILEMNEPLLKRVNKNEQL